jgi:N-acetyl sugar amidotransferase
MKPFPQCRPSEAAAWSDRDDGLVAYYGLPEAVRFCSICVLPNQRPASAIEYRHDRTTRKVTTTLDEHGVCDGCRIHRLKHGKIDWGQREEELRALCDRFRSRTGHYDCVVPGSGGKDSGYAAHLLKYKFGMHPLTVTWAPHIYTPWGWENFQSWIHSGFDNYLFTPNGRVHRLLTRIALETLFHPFQPFIIGQKLFAPRLAAQLGIPLVFWGEPEAEDGNPIASYGSAEQDWSYFTSESRDSIRLSGVALGDLKEHFQLAEKDLDPYLPMNPEILRRAGVQVHYMGYYVRWHPQANYYYATEHTGFKAAPERTAGTYGKYSGVDDKIDDFHFYTTFIKFGIGRATYDAAQEARNGDLTREEAVDLVRRYDGEFPTRFAEACFNYMSLPKKEFPIASRMFECPLVSREYFDMLTDHFRSPHLWKKTIEGWKLRHTVWQTQ